MPATIEDYKKVAGNISALQSEAGQYTSAATNLSGQVMEAVRTDRASRGISQMATDVGTTMGQIPTDTAGIRARTGAMVAPMQQDVLTAAQRGQNLQTLGTIATQSEYNQGTLKDILSEQAAGLQAVAQQKQAEAQQAATKAQSIMEELEYNRQLQQDAWDRYVQEQQLAQGWTRLNNEGVPNPKETTKAEGTLRAEYNKQLKDSGYNQQLNNYQKINALADNTKATAATDMALLYSYMKLLDPSSVVRESEYANAENARGVPDTIRNLYNKAIKGKRLTDTQRNNMVLSTEATFGTYQNTMNNIKEYYDALAEAQGLDKFKITGGTYTVDGGKPGEIRVRKKSTGEEGWLPEDEFNSSEYERL